MSKLRAVVGLNYTASVFEMIGRLVDAGHLQRVAMRIAPTKAFLALPFEQVASGGSETPATSGSPSAVNLLDYVMPDRKGAFLATVTDDQLAQRDVHKGDLLLMNESEPAKAGDIVARRANERVWLSLVSSASAKKLVLKPLYAATSAVPSSSCETHRHRGCRRCSGPQVRPIAR